MRNIGFCGVLLGWLPGQGLLFVRSRYVSIACPEGRNGSGSVTSTQRETSRTRCVWGNTVVPELPSPPQRARPFHSHSIQTPASPFQLFHSQAVQTQASPFHLSRGVIRSITLFFGWDICSSISSSSFGVLTACSAESLVQTSLPSLAQEYPDVVVSLPQGS